MKLYPIKPITEYLVHARSTPFSPAEIGKAVLMAGEMCVVITLDSVLQRGVADIHHSQCNKLVRGGWDIIGMGDLSETIRVSRS